MRSCNPPRYRHNRSQHCMEHELLVLSIVSSWITLIWTVPIPVDERSPTDLILISDSMRVLLSRNHRALIALLSPPSLNPFVTTAPFCNAIISFAESELYWRSPGCTCCWRDYYDSIITWVSRVRHDGINRKIRITRIRNDGFGLIT